MHSLLRVYKDNMIGIVLAQALSTHLSGPHLSLYNKLIAHPITSCIALFNFLQFSVLCLTLFYIKSNFCLVLVYLIS